MISLRIKSSEQRHNNSSCGSGYPGPAIALGVTHPRNKMVDDTDNQKRIKPLCALPGT